MSTRIIEVFEYCQLSIHIDETFKLYHKALFMYCNN